MICCAFCVVCFSFRLLCVRPCAAPYQFSDLCSMILLTGATIAFFDGDEDGDSDTAGAVLLAVQALISFLELFF